MNVSGNAEERPLKCRRRKIGSTRFEVNVDVQFLSSTPGGAAIEGLGVVRNLSMRGALIEAHTLVTTGDRLTLYVTLPNLPDLLEIPTVVVRWVRGHQLGVEFLKLRHVPTLNEVSIRQTQCG